MIYTKMGFIKRLQKMMLGKTQDYQQAVQDVLDLISSEGGCFRPGDD